jgi:hypothetical protein
MTQKLCLTYKQNSADKFAEFRFLFSAKRQARLIQLTKQSVSSLIIKFFSRFHFHRFFRHLPSLESVGGGGMDLSKIMYNKKSDYKSRDKATMGRSKTSLFQNGNVFTLQSNETIRGERSLTVNK